MEIMMLPGGNGWERIIIETLSLNTFCYYFTLYVAMEGDGKKLRFHRR